MPKEDQTMEQSAERNVAPKKRSNPFIRQRFLLISIILLIVILIGGSIAFVYSMRQIVHANKRTELLQLVEIQRYSLEASVNREISIVLEMAISPVITEHFLHPEDEDLKRIAFDEIARFTRSLMSNSSFWVSDADKHFYLGEVKGADKEFRMDDENQYVINPDDPETYWYKMTMYETEVYNFNINYNPDLQVTNFWINAPVFDSKGNPIGILGTGINLTEFVDTIYRNYKGEASLYFFNSTGEITGASDMALVADKINLNRILSVTGPEILSWAKGDSSDTMQAFFGPEGEIAVCPIPVVDWDILAVQPLFLADYLDTSMTPLFIAIMGIIIIFFIILQIGKYAFDTINRTRQELRVERDFIAAMKDNLSAGIFLMDRDFIIQGSYSKPLENILGTNEIEGKKFTDFLVSSLKAKESETLEDYFTMIINRQFDTTMLEGLNPIIELTYKDETRNEEKIIKTAFSSVDMGSGNYFIKIGRAHV